MGEREGQKVWGGWGRWGGEGDEEEGGGGGGVGVRDGGDSRHQVCPPVASFHSHCLSSMKDSAPGPIYCAGCVCMCVRPLLLRLLPATHTQTKDI